MKKGDGGKGLPEGSKLRDVAGVGIAQKQKPPFRPAQDDSKPLLQDPILRSDLIEIEQAVIRLPPFPRKAS
ncbi:hypothetical protein AXF42_Ash004131 [Apostasia shenzhenica]|uniref:Uncharacterized protein n=1 Tax=Apostasia shenzhenica TaxID=1088818 RepID=A0A2I0A205_9ASPA|nr:hypothetical protein AXF42_Ash004131 [Apostasia shenzhenica]